VRPLVQDDGNIVMHHGSITVPHALRDAVQELVAFASQNPDELIILYISHCFGDNCMELTKTLLQGIAVPTCTDGSQLTGATYGSIKQMGALPGGGAMLGLFGAVNENYNDQISCYSGGVGGRRNGTSSTAAAAAAVRAGAGAAASSSSSSSSSSSNISNSSSSTSQPDGLWYCYGDQSAQESAFEPMWSYLRTVSARLPDPSGSLNMLQVRTRGLAARCTLRAARYALHATRCTLCALRTRPTALVLRYGAR
jgi:hypothetical protein